LDGSIAFADVNGDGKPDLLVANGQSNTIGVLLNNSGAPLTTTTLTSSHNPVPAGRKNTVTYTASIAAQAGGAVTGNVIFRDGGFAIATVPVANRQATYSTAYTYGGAHPMTAIYSGDANNAGSISATLTEYVESVTTRTLITTSGSPSLVGQPVTFTATVTAKHGTVPDGEMVTFYDDAAAMASVSLANGKATYTTSSLSTNTRSVKASYPGDTTLEPSSKSVPQTVLKYSTTTSLTSTPNPSLHGKPVSFTATVAPSGPHAPIGRVKFWDGTTSIGMASLKSGMATLNKSTLGVGTHAITAQYLSDAYNDKSTSAIVEQVVQ
jgi:hypothetical protein